jgi:hypothetical protein
MREPWGDLRWQRSAKEPSVFGVDRDAVMKEYPKIRSRATEIR